MKRYETKRCVCNKVLRIYYQDGMEYAEKKCDCGLVSFMQVEKTEMAKDGTVYKTIKISTKPQGTDIAL